LPDLHIFHLFSSLIQLYIISLGFLLSER